MLEMALLANVVAFQVRLAAAVVEVGNTRRNSGRVIPRLFPVILKVPSFHSV